MPVACAKTGVKHLHKLAEQLFDVGVYFEANGHGTVIVKDAVKAQVRSRADAGHPGARTLMHLIDLINETVGDALSIFLLVEVLRSSAFFTLGCIVRSALRFTLPCAQVILMIRGWSTVEWDGCYSDLPNKMMKVSVRDRHAISTTDAERRCVSPVGMQDAIDAAVGKYGRGRSFVRPSGTEDVVRVYAEAGTRDAAEELAAEVASLVRSMAGGL